MFDRRKKNRGKRLMVGSTVNPMDKGGKRIQGPMEWIRIRMERNANGRTRTWTVPTIYTCI